MPSHLRAAMTQISVNIPFAGGELLLGTWQGIFLFEHRRARLHQPRSDFARYGRVSRRLPEPRSPARPARINEGHLRAPFPDLSSIAAGGKRGLSRALAMIETHEGTAELAALLDAAIVQTRAHAAGLTGLLVFINRRSPTRCCATGARAARRWALSRSIRRRGALAGRFSATAPAWRPTPTIRASSSAPWRRATGSADCPTRPSPLPRSCAPCLTGR